MILVDTSVWIDVSRQRQSHARSVIVAGDLVVHDFVVGELLLGHFRRGGDEFLRLLGDLPRAIVARHEDVLAVIARFNLQGSGIGWVDAHLLASCVLTGAKLWTNDRSLAVAAERAHLAYKLD